MARMLRQIDDEALERPFNKKQFLRVLRYMIPYKKRIIGALILMVMATFASLGSTFLLSRAVSELEAARSTYIGWLLAAMVAVSAVMAICTRYRVRLMDVAGRKALSTLREDLFKHIQHLGFTFFDTRSAGKILVRVINDVNSLNDLFTNGIVNVLVECMTLVVLMFILVLVIFGI